MSASPPTVAKRKYVRKDPGPDKRQRKDPPTVPSGLAPKEPVPPTVVSQSHVPGVAQAPNTCAISSLDAAAAKAQKMADLALAVQMEFKKELLTQQCRVDVETSMKEYKARLTDCDMAQTKQVVECNVYLSRFEQELIRRTEIFGFGQRHIPCPILIQFFISNANVPNRLHINM